MLNITAQIDTGQSLVMVEDICRYCKPLPELWLYTQEGNNIYRASQSGKDFDVFIAFRQRSRLVRFSKHDEFVDLKGLSAELIDLQQIVARATKDTIIAMDPWWDNKCGLSYDDFFLITFLSYRHSKYI